MITNLDNQSVQNGCLTIPTIPIAANNPDFLNNKKGKVSLKNKRNQTIGRVVEERVPVHEGESHGDDGEDGEGQGHHAHHEATRPQVHTAAAPAEARHSTLKHTAFKETYHKVF